MSKLAALLSYGPAHHARDPAGQWLLVAPRAGTTSPWSSKATDIAHVCGLEAIHRIERGIAFHVMASATLSDDALRRLATPLHDRMTETVLLTAAECERLFAHHAPGIVGTVARDVRRCVPQPFARTRVERGRNRIRAADSRACSCPKDVELRSSRRRIPDIAAQDLNAASSSRHPHRVAVRVIATHCEAPPGVLSALGHASVSKGRRPRLFRTWRGDYRGPRDPANPHEGETHNHPPHFAVQGRPRARWRDRDEGATARARNRRPGSGVFGVELCIQGFGQHWERSVGKPDRIVSALDIMLEAPLGAAAFNNEFGRPCIAGYFRPFEQGVAGSDMRARGYHKPIMIAGGLGNIRRAHVEKDECPVGAHLVVLGGPAMLIGLGGGRRVVYGQGQSFLICFASVQRGNPETSAARRSHRSLLGHCGMPIPAPIHDVGACGLSTPFGSLAPVSGAVSNCATSRMPTCMWPWRSGAEAQNATSRCAEAGAGLSSVAPANVPLCGVGPVRMTASCECTTAFRQSPVDLRHVPRATRMKRDVTTARRAAERVLAAGGPHRRGGAARALHPAVADKTSLITCDRTFTGHIIRNQLSDPGRFPGRMAVTSRATLATPARRW